MTIARYYVRNSSLNTTRNTRNQKPKHSSPSGFDCESRALYNAYSDRKFVKCTRKS